MHIKVMLEYFYPWTNSAGLYVAREEGWYRDLGLDVELCVYDPGRGDSLAYLVRGEATFALCPSNRLLVRREQGQPVCGVAAINHRGLEAIQTIRGRGIERPRDLAGKRVALNPTPRGLAMVRHLVAYDGGDPAAVVVVDSGVRELLPEQIMAGEVDATFGSYWAWEILMDTVVPAEQRLVWPVDEIGAPPYHSYLLATNERMLAEQPDVVRAFLAATARGYAAAARDPQRAALIYEHVIPYFPASLVRRSLPLIATTWLYRNRWGEQREELVRPYAGWLAQAGVLRNAAVWQSAIINDFLPTT